MMKLRIWLFVVIVLLMLTAPVFGQDDDTLPPEPTLAEETAVTDAAEVEVPAADTDTVEVEAPVDDGDTAIDWLRLAFENDLHWYIFAILALFLAGNLIPPDEMQRRREQARQTETPADDVLYAILEGVQMLRGKTDIPLTKEDTLTPAESAPPFTTASLSYTRIDVDKPDDPTPEAAG
jgi:hypothetical protein